MYIFDMFAYFMLKISILVFKEQNHKNVFGILVVLAFKYEYLDEYFSIAGEYFNYRIYVHIYSFYAESLNIRIQKAKHNKNAQDYVRVHRHWCFYLTFQRDCRGRLQSALCGV